MKETVANEKIFYRQSQDALQEKLSLHAQDDIYILTRQPLDIARWRNLLHLWQREKDKQEVLLATQLFTVRDFLRKQTAPFQLADFEAVSPLQLQHLIEQLLKEEQGKEILEKFSASLLFPGFSKELARLYSLSHWHNNLKEILPRSHKENIHYLYNFFRYIDKSLESRNLLHEAELLRRITSKQKPQPNHKQKVIFWLFPFTLEKQEQQKLLFLNRVQTYQWVLFGDSLSSMKKIQKPENGQKNLLNFLEVLDSEKRLTQVDIPVKQEIQTQNMHVVSVNSDQAEADLAVRQTIRLLQQGVSREKIIILYSKESLASTLRLAFFKADVPVNLPERKKIALNEEGKFFSLLFVLCANMPLSRQELAEFFSSPFLNRRAFAEIAEGYLYPLAWKNYILQELPLQKQRPSQFYSFIKNNKYNEGSPYTESKNHLAAALKQLADEFAEPALDAPSVWVEQARELLSCYCISGVSLQENFRARFLKNLKAVARFLDNFAKLDKVYAKTLSSQVFVQKFLGDFEEVIVSFEGSIDNPEQDSYQQNAEIYCRPLREGIASFVDYAIVCGLNESVFPYREKGAELFENKDLQEKLQWFSAPEEKIFSLRQSLAMVQKEILFVYRFDDSKGPSRVIFSLLQEKYPQSDDITKNYKKSLLEKVPTLVYYAGKEPQWPNDGAFSFLKDMPKLQDEIYANNRESGKKNQSLYQQLAQWKYQDNVFSTQNFSYLGNLKLNTEDFANFREMSVSAFEDLASCPQKFLFKNIFRLQDVEQQEFSFLITALEKGNYFHALAEEVFKAIQAKLGKCTYRDLQQKFSLREWQELLTEKSEIVRQKFFAVTGDSFSIQSGLLENLQKKSFAFLNNFYQNLDLPLKKTSISLASFRPLLIEQKFENLQIGNFILKGKIDRVDIDEENKKILLIDYKTGKHLNNGLLQRWNFFDAIQIAFYMLAVIQNKKEFLGNIDISEYSISAVYWHVFSDAYQAVCPTDSKSKKEENLKYFSLPKTINLVKNIDEFSQNIFSENINNKLSLLDEILQKQQFFSVFDEIEKVVGDKANKYKSSPCLFCRFFFACDASPSATAQQRFFNGTSEKSLPWRYAQAFFAAQA